MIFGNFKNNELINLINEKEKERGNRGNSSCLFDYYLINYYFI